MDAPRLLLTGFGAFESVERNPSGELAQALAGDPGLVTRVLPVTFRGCAQVLDDALAALPRLAGVVCTGVHRGASFRLERRARASLGSARLDNAGEDGAAVSGAMGGGDGDLATSLDLVDLGALLAACGAREVQLSDDAGGYVCERAYRHALVRAAERGVPAVFLHVPPLELVPLEHQLTVVRGFVTGLRARIP